MSLAAGRVNLKKPRSGRSRHGAPFHSFVKPSRRWVRGFKTTNAQGAQPAAMRHKRALKALLGKMRRRPWALWDGIGPSRRSGCKNLLFLVVRAREAASI
jgi:hypothetical protein